MRVQPWLVVLALTGGTLVGAGHVGDQPTAREAQTLEVTAKRTLMSAPANIAVGGGFVSGGELYDGAGRTKLGEGYSHCGVVSVSVAVPPAVTTHCTSVFRLPDGQLQLAGLRTYKSIAGGFDDTTMAVTGGTGKYAGARGEAKVTRAASRAEVTYRYAFALL
ncbi:allene oxide cyclase barrel-like domain-containing protein [Actinophytocola sp.]|uniref:allene oxide cyclase barrel-like domain-containing protein n=1 Tax=Actinophytocola sp. TaxID=1872138 RepID=UPI003899EA8A